MSKADPLFLLIKSMSKSEKRHFKLFTSKNELRNGKDYLRLFDVIDNQKEYNEEAIIKKFKDEPYFSQLRSVKLYLYNQLIKSLKNLHEESSSRILLENFLVEIEILFQKQLYKSCTRVIRRAKAYAQKYENHTKMLDLIRWEAKVAMYIKDVEQIESMRSDWVKEEQQAIDHSIELFELRKLNYELMSFFFRKGFAKTEEELQTVKQILSSDLLTTEKKAFLAEMARLSMEGNCLAILGRVDDRYLGLKKLVKLLDSQPHHVYENLNEYLLTLCNVFSLSVQQREFTFSEDLMEKIDRLCTERPHQVHTSTLIICLRSKIFFSLTKGEFREALGQAQLLEKLILQSGSKTDAIDGRLIDLQQSVVYFANQNYSKAQQFIQKIMNADLDIRLDIQTTARVIYLIIQYETQEYEHLEYAWRSTYRYLLKKKRLQKSESILLDFIRRTRQMNPNTEVLRALATLKQNIIALNDRQFMSGFPFIEWLDSKLEKKSLGEIMKENYLKLLEDSKVKSL